MAAGALDERVGEGIHVAGRHPDLSGLDDCRVDADDVLPLEDHGPPPLLLDVAQQLHPQRTVVVGGAQPAVDLGSGEGETPLLGEFDDRVEGDRHGLRMIRHRPEDGAKPTEGSGTASVTRRDPEPGPTHLRDGGNAGAASPLLPRIGGPDPCTPRYNEPARFGRNPATAQG